MASARARHERDGSVPTTILEAFPVPPSYIPSLSAAATPQNPPPSRPPSLPLPPVPGPSRISEHDLVLLSSANSRPSSKYSTHSLDKRDSLVSSTGSSGRASVASGPPPPLVRRLSNASVRSATSRYGPTIVRPSVISEEEPVEERLTRLAISPVPLSDDDDLATSPPTAVLSSPLKLFRSRRHHHHKPSDSISSIDIRDLLAVTDEDEPVVPPFNAFRAVSNSDVSAKRHTGLTITVPARASHDILAIDTVLADPIDPHTITINQPIDQDAIRPPPPPGQTTTLSFPPMMASSSPPLPSPSPLSPPKPLSPQQLHREIRAARSKSPSHKQVLRARSSSRGPSSSSHPHEHPIPPLPRSAPPTRETKFVQPPPSSFPTQRSSSPDIDSIISATPRPARSLRKHPSSEWGANTRSSFASSSLSVGSSSRRSRKTSNVSSSNGNELDDDEGEGACPGEEAVSDGDDDDSSIDLHTPLPHLMVKHGLLSPHSKLLPQTDSERRTSSPSLNPDGRPSSTLSTVTKSGVIKDERNTPMRKERHRDGKLLRGGIGLTTGLGWSDSEDEDAPSPLTRRLSNLNLTTRSSTASIRSTSHRGDRSGRATITNATPSARSSAAHPLSKSYSGGTTYSDIAEDVDEFGQRISKSNELTRPRTTSSASASSTTAVATKVKAPAGTSQIAGPPTSWHGRPKISTSTNQNSLRPKSRLSSPNDANTNIRRISNTSTSDDTVHTPSSASSSLMSISLPQTPQDNDLGGIGLPGSISRKGSRAQGTAWDKDKMLPPIPLQPILKKQSSKSKIATLGSRSRAGSVSTSTTSTSVSRPVTPGTAGPRSLTPGPVRPLQLPQRYATPNNDRPPVPVPSIPPQVLRNSASHGGLPAPTASSISPKPPALTPSRSVPGLSTAKSSTGSTSTAAAPAAAAAGAMSVPTSPVMGPPPLLPSPNVGVKPKPRTGTGMVYKRSTSNTLNSLSTPSSAGLAGIGSGAGVGGTRMRAPMPLVSASLASVSAVAMTSGKDDVGASGVKGVSSGLAIRAAVARGKVPRLTIGAGGTGGSNIPVGPTTPTTPIGQAF